MAATASSYSITMRLHTAPNHHVVGAVATSIAQGGGVVTAIDVTESRHDRLVVDVTCFLDLAPAAGRDELARTVDYGELAAAVRRLDDATARARALDAGSALAAAATWEASVTKLLRAMGVSAPEDVAGVHGCGPDLISAPHPPHAPPVPPTTRPQRRG